MIKMLIQSILVGFIIAVPIGPAAVMIIQRTLTRGRVYGIIAAIGAGIADTVFGGIAVFGLSWIQDWLISWIEEIRLVGGLFLSIKGIMLLCAPTVNPMTPRNSGLWASIAATFTLTLTNPLTGFAYIAILAVFNIVSEALTLASAALVCVALFTGAMLWWGTLVMFSGLFGNQLSQDRHIWINRVAGTILLFFGGILLLGFFYPPILDWLKLAHLS